MTPTQIHALRSSLGLTQQEFAALIGLRTRGAVAHLEDGRRAPTPPVLILLRLLRAEPKRARKMLEKVADSC